MTKEKDKGDRFEIWTENLLRDLGYDRVRRNVNYHKKYKKNAYRQVDIEYVNYLNPFETFVGTGFPTFALFNLKMRPSAVP